MAIEHNHEPLDDDPQFEEPPAKRGAFPSVKVNMTRQELWEMVKKRRKVVILWGIATLLVAVMAGCAVIGAAHATAHAGQKTTDVAGNNQADQQAQQEQEQEQWARREQMMQQQASQNMHTAANPQYANGQQFPPEMRQRILDCENGTGSCAGVPQQYWPQYGQNSGPQGGGMTADQQAAQAAKQQREEFSWKARFAGPNDGPVQAEKKALASVEPARDTGDTSSPKPNNEAATSADPKTDDDTGQEKKAPYSQATGHEYRLMGGITQIPARIENGITAELGGAVLAFTTDDVWSWNHQAVIIPKGSFITGKYRKVGSNSEERVDVLLDSLVMPDGYRVNFADAEGLDVTGETGLRDKVNHHYIQVFATSIGIASVGGIAQLGNNTGGYTYSPESVMRQGFAGGMGQAGEQALNRYSNRPPTLTIPPGTVLNLYFPHDMLLSAYSAHQMDPNL